MKRALFLGALVMTAGCAAQRSASFHSAASNDALVTTRPTTQLEPTTEQWKYREVLVGDLVYSITFAPRPANRINQYHVASSYLDRHDGPVRYVVIEFQVMNVGQKTIVVPQPMLMDEHGAEYQQARETILANDMLTGSGRLNPDELKNAAAAFLVGQSADPSKYSIVFGAPGEPPKKVPLK